MGGRRIVALVAVLGIGMIASATPAEAHTRTQETTNIESRVTHNPLPDGVTFTVRTGGFLIEVENHTRDTLVVHGYEGEPYLRIGPMGVEHNRRSPATYLNRERYRQVAMPPDVDAAASPEWIAISQQPRHVFHDHRAHWMSPMAPAFVDAGPVADLLMRTGLVGPIGRANESAGTFQQWEIPVTYAGQALAVRGELVWQDPPRPWPWLLLAGLAVAPALLGWRHRDASDAGGLVRPAALVVGAVALINGIHLVDDLIAWPSNPLDELSGLLHTTIFLVGGIGGAAWAWFGTSGRVLALAIGSGSVLYHQGLVHLPMLFATFFPTVWPDGLVRLTIALGLLQAVAVAAVVIRRMNSEPVTSLQNPAVAMRR